MRSGSASARRQRGFGYLLLLVLIAVLAATAAATVRMGTAITRRHAEEALLDLGDDFRAAIISYRTAGGPAAGGPRELAELLRDPRVPGVRRHLRSVPADPLTGVSDWGLVRDNAGRILAVYSLAPGKPLKRTGFGPTQLGFDDAEGYAQWQFGIVLRRPPVPGAPGAPASAASTPPR